MPTGGPGGQGVKKRPVAVASVFGNDDSDDDEEESSDDDEEELDENKTVSRNLKKVQFILNFFFNNSIFKLTFFLFF